MCARAKSASHQIQIILKLTILSLAHDIFEREYFSRYDNNLWVPVPSSLQNKSYWKNGNRNHVRPMKLKSLCQFVTFKSFFSYKIKHQFNPSDWLTSGRDRTSYTVRRTWEATARNSEKGNIDRHAWGGSKSERLWIPVNHRG